MKTFFLLFFTILSFYGMLSAQSTTEPEPIFSITKAMFPTNYYESQAELWKKETEKQPDNPDTWYNFFKAARNIRISGGDNPHDMTKLLEDMGKVVPNSFEYHFATFWHSTSNEHNWDALKKAYEINPSRSITYKDFLTYYQKLGDEKQLAFFAKKWLESGDFEPLVLDWNYNLLIGVEENGILITYGDSDTYPIWLLQYGLNIRKDVTVMNIHLVTGWEAYRNRLFRQMGIPALNNKDLNTQNLHASCLEHILKNARQTVDVAVSVRPSMHEKFESELHLVGLALRYSETPIDNLAILKNNWENQFRKDNLQLPYSLKKEGFRDMKYYMMMNYMPAILKLIGHYHKSGAPHKADELRELGLKIGERANMLTQVKSYLAEID